MSEKIKVLRIIARLNMGGPATHVTLLASSMDPERFSSYLVSGTVDDDEEDVAHRARERGVEPLIISELGRGINLRRDFGAFLKLYRLMKSVKPDIVHTHTAKAGTLGRIAAVLSGVPVKIHTFHGHVFHSYFGILKTGFFVTVEKALARFTDKIIVISGRQLEDISGKYRIAPRQKCVVVPLGLELGPFLNIKEKKGTGPLRVGIIGRLVSVKNHRLFLDAARKISRAASGAGVKFFIVGDGPLRAELEAYALSLGLKDSIVFTGWRSDIESVYNRLDVVCMTSLNEGTPISIIEAMASARPVAATDVGGVSDLVRDGVTGYLSASGDADGFSANVIKLLGDDKLRGQMGAAARVSVAQAYSAGRLVADIERIYDNELGKKGYPGKAVSMTEGGPR